MKISCESVNDMKNNIVSLVYPTLKRFYKIGFFIGKTILKVLDVLPNSGIGFFCQIFKKLSLAITRTVAWQLLRTLINGYKYNRLFIDAGS